MPLYVIFAKCARVQLAAKNTSTLTIVFFTLVQLNEGSTRHNLYSRVNSYQWTFGTFYTLHPDFQLKLLFCEEKVKTLIP